MLAIDTTSEDGSIALLDGNERLEELVVVAADGFAQLLFPAIQSLLARHNWTLAEVDLFAAASGPGSFTGVRVGLAAVKGLAEAHGRLAAAVSSLRALAGQGTGRVRMPLINARRGEVYAGLYDGELRVLEPERVGGLTTLLPHRPEGAELICRGSWPELTANGLTVHEDPRPLAAMVARLAARDGGVDPAAIDANYVRRSDADGRWEDSV